jgi:hypothetical protein
MIVKLTTDTDYKNREARARRSKGPGGSSSVEKSKSPFLEILDEILPASIDQNRDLHDLWSDLPGLERDLIDHPSEENLNIYRETVRLIARMTLDKNVRVAHIYRKNRHNEKIELNLIEIVDDRLHKMALMMRSSSNTAFSILKTLDEIRGLLLDSRQ